LRERERERERDRESISVLIVGSIKITIKTTVNILLTAVKVVNSGC
jgi:hypothetical protein